MKLNEWIKTVRKDSGLTMRDVAKETHYTAATICHYERGDRKIPVDYLKYWISKGYNLKLEEIEDEDIGHT